MPRRCSVFGCRSNYDTESKLTTTFALPKNDVLRQKWLRNIVNDISKFKRPVVCIKHFEESCLIRVDRVFWKGEHREFPRVRIKLSENAEPTIFKCDPSYCSKKTPNVRRLKDVKEENMQQHVSDSLESNIQCIERDQVSSVNDITVSYCSKETPSVRRLNDVKEENMQQPVSDSLESNIQYIEREREEPELEQPEQPEATAASVYGLCVSKLEQRACVKFCVKLEKSAAETLRMLREAFGGEAMGSRQCFRWHARFAAGHASLEDEQRSGDGGGGRPRKKRAAHARHVLQVLAEDPSLTYREMGKALALTCPMCRKIALTDLRMHRVCGKMVPRSLTFDEKRERVSICLDLLTSANDDPTFISRIISCGESWFFGCHSVLKGKSRCVNCKNSNSVTPWPKKPQGRLPSRGLLVVFFDVEGIIHWEFSPCTEALEGEWYCEILSRLRDAIRQKRPSLWKNSNWMLHHDNSRAHNALVTRQFLADNHVTVVPHPQCSCAPDLTPWDIAFMEGLKMRMRVRAIKTPAKFLPALAKDLNALKVKDFQNAFLRVRTHWELCLNSHGDYCTEE